MILQYIELEHGTGLRVVAVEVEDLGKRTSGDG